jgi:CRP/FNR family transcriptional regulator, cyclic AMP receptor protein
VSLSESRGAILRILRNPPMSDLDKLTHLDAFSWLSASELIMLAGALKSGDFKRRQIILGETALSAEAHILLKGIARITCQEASGGKRLTIALLAPGPIPEFPPLRFSRFDFRCEAYHDCRVGSLSWDEFHAITVHSSHSALKTFQQNDLRLWYRLLLRSSVLLNVALHERIALSLLELSSDFGIQDSRGMLLNASFSHQDIADLVGASRPRVTEHLAQLEREHLIIRDGRRLVVCVEEIENAVALPHRETPARKQIHPARKAFLRTSHQGMPARVDATRAVAGR